MEFRPMPKTPRLSREIVITEKIDGTNASVYVGTGEAPFGAAAQIGDLWLVAGFRTRWISPGDDNFGFAAWVRDNAEELVKLGPGHHFGEWWGYDIQRGYGLDHRRFSLFNVGRWFDLHSGGEYPVVPEGMDAAPACCHVVPTLYRGKLDVYVVERELDILRNTGSVAAPGFMDPEGVMVYHTAANQLFKKTLKGDEEGKHAEAHPKKERPPRPPRDPSMGGRRKGATEGYAGPWRRKTDDQR